jgi:superfamily II DNA or RNA helicase
MPNLIEIEYEQTGASASINHLGMREMQARAYDARDHQYILLKAPPASGKSRAMMFLALDKLAKQGLKKVVIAVPEQAIGASFRNTPLSKHGFWMDWTLDVDLCLPEGNQAKVKAFQGFMADPMARVLVCTHSTFRFAVEKLGVDVFEEALIGIDEFHHVSTEGENVLGDCLDRIMSTTSAHVVAMTGSYFRGDNTAILSPENESKFHDVVYDYYEQLNGYEFLKSLGIGYHFYQGKYIEALAEVLKLEKKTIVHIPSVNAREAYSDKYTMLGDIMDIIGTNARTDDETGIITLTTAAGKDVRIADLVTDDDEKRALVKKFLANIENEDEVDIIIALGMAKEGFDWKFCEHSLTIGYRGSLTEVVQIIGRCTRDSPNKDHAQFTNLVAEPRADSDDVAEAVNDMLKAITCSLLMEQVMAPVFKFKPKVDPDEPGKQGNTIAIKGLKKPSTKKVQDIVDTKLRELKAAILGSPDLQKAIVNQTEAAVVNKQLIPKIIMETFPELTQKEVAEVTDHVLADTLFSHGKQTQEGDKRFINFAKQFINIDDLHIDMIYKINPFQHAYEVLSKSLDKDVLESVQGVLATQKAKITEEELNANWHLVETFEAEHGCLPNFKSKDQFEARLGLMVQKARQLFLAANMKEDLELT